MFKKLRQKLNDKEYRKVWGRFNKEFKFKPSTTEFPSYEVPSPFITYDISHVDLIEVEMSDEDYEKIVFAITKTAKNNENVYLLDWQHECFKVSQLELKDFPLFVFPDGDYTFIVNENFTWGYLGHPWEETITVFGDLVTELIKCQPYIFSKILRQG